MASLTRRDVLKLGVFGGAALMLPLERVARTQLALANRIPQSQLPKPFTVPFVQAPVLQPAFSTPATAYYDIEQRPASVEILPGLRTTIWGYNGIAPGPTIVNTQGQEAVVRQRSSLPAVHPSLRYNVWTSVHLHGSASLPEYDGYASDITPPGQYKDYHYPNIQDARTLWYHDHGIGITAPNAYMGLAAFYILHDANELALPIPHGAYDVPLCLRDAMFQTNGELIFDENSGSGMFGDVILVNGKPWPLMEVEPRKYRFRLLNGSVSRSFDLALDTGEPLIVIGTDGGLMPHPQPVSHFRFGMAERYEVVIDFAKYKPGQRVVLQNLQPPNNIEFPTTNVVMAFQVGDTVSSGSNNEVPRDLNPSAATMSLTPADALRTRNFRFERKNGEWTINGTTWADVINSDFQFTIANPGFNDVEIWELENPSGGWFHPVHVHLVDFRILDRNGQPPLPHELGPKDVAYVGENEKVRVIMRFEHQRGKYMMHCHNLVHEDHDMMTQFEVGHSGHDPRLAARARHLPAGALFERPEEDHGGSHGDAARRPGLHGGGSIGASGHGVSGNAKSQSKKSAKHVPVKHSARHHKPAKHRKKAQHHKPHHGRKKR
jgi:FtsP/CotA-like multicopper oxidase with cupredoxin domain